MAGMGVDQITGGIVDAAIAVHRGLGPGLLESVYQSVMSAELSRRGMNVERQKYVNFEFNGMVFERSLCVDLLVERRVVVELKSIERIAPVHWKQVLTYLRLLHLDVGLLLNFGEFTMKQGIHRIRNGYSAHSVLRDSVRE